MVETVQTFSFLIGVTQTGSERLRQAAGRTRPESATFTLLSSLPCNWVSCEASAGPRVHVLLRGKARSAPIVPECGARRTRPPAASRSQIPLLCHSRSEGKEPRLESNLLALAVVVVVRLDMIGTDEVTMAVMEGVLS